MAENGHTEADISSVGQGETPVMAAASPVVASAPEAAPTESQPAASAPKTANPKPFMPRWVGWTLLAVAVPLLAVAIWVRYVLGITALDGTQECGACHIMQPYLASLEQSQHNGLANCDDCHVPHKSAAQYYTYKLQAGVRNVGAWKKLRDEGKLETTVPKATAETLGIVTENCWRCHDAIDEHLNEGVMLLMPHGAGTPGAEDMQLPPRQASADVEVDSISCLDCHKGLIHDAHYTTPDPSKPPTVP